VIPGVASYEPPAFLSAYNPGSASGDPFSGARMAINYHANDNAGGSPHRQLNIGMQAVGFTIGEGYRVTWNPVTEDEIKKLMVDRASKRATNFPKVETIQIAGRKAYKTHSVVPMPQIHDGIVFQFETIWIPVNPNHLVTLSMSASDEKLLKTLQDSLTSFKILPGAEKRVGPKEPELVVVKDAVRLGDERAQVHKLCGKAVVSRPSSDTFYTGIHFVSVGYSMPLADSVTYARVSDAGKYLKSLTDDSRERLTFHQPLGKDEIQELLNRHAVGVDGRKLTWKLLEENAWERSDGARAVYEPTLKFFAIAAKDAWPKMSVFPK